VCAFRHLPALSVFPYRSSSPCRARQRRRAASATADPPTARLMPRWWSTPRPAACCTPRTRTRPATPLLVVVGTGVINENPAHDLRRDTVKMRSVLPARILPIRQPQVSFIDQRPRFERVLRILTPHGSPGQLSQFCIDQRGKLLGCERVSFIPGLQQDGDFFSAEVPGAVFRSHDVTLLNGDVDRGCAPAFAVQRARTRAAPRR